MKIYRYSEAVWEALKIRPALFADRALEDTVRTIIETVRNEKDDALFAFTQTFDHVQLDALAVTASALKDAYDGCDPLLLASLEKAKAAITRFHTMQKRHGYIDANQSGQISGQIIRPIERVGLYIPGGTAAYPSTVLMNAIPALIAGCQEIVIVSPPPISPIILAAAYLCNITEVYQVGGAQAIAALAYGTPSIPAVDKIYGPGNAYVTAAKKRVSGSVGIDMLAGPTEILIIADDSALPSWIAADLLAQAEHDPQASCMLLTPYESLAQAVVDELECQIASLPRQSIAQQALSGNSFILIADSLKQACQLSNQLAPEHLSLAVHDPHSLLSDIRRAGSIFLGPYSPEALGDYLAGPNHTLPTSGTARFSSGLSVDDFITKSTFIHYTKAALSDVKDDIIMLAQAEQLDGHARSISQRFTED